MANNSKWFWMWYYDVKYNNTSYVPSKVYDSNILTNWKYLSTATLGDNTSNKSQTNYAYVRIGYYWDTIDKTNRTAKIHIRMELVEFQNYVCINNQSLLQFGMNIVNHTKMNKNIVKGIVEYKPYLMNVSGYTYANRGNPFYDNYITYTSYGNPYPYGVIGTNSGSFYNNYGGKSRNIANHIIIIEQQEATIPYNAEGVASATINYDISLGYQIVSNGKKFNAYGKGTFVVKDAPNIGKLITGLSVTSNKTVTLTPKSMSLTGLSGSTTNYDLTAGTSKTFGATIDSFNPSQFTQSFSVSPSNAGGNVSVTSSATNIVSINTPTVNVANSSNRKFTATAKQVSSTPATITLKGNGKTATMKCTVNAADKTIVWSSDNSSVVTVDNGKVTAVSGRSGKATITAKCKSNTSVFKTLTINSLLKPNSITITADKNALIPGETITFTITLNPYSTDSTKCVTSTYRGVTWYLVDDSNVKLKEGTNKQGKFTVTYTLPKNTASINYIRLVARSTDFADIMDSKTIDTSKILPTSFTITSDKSSVYPGETVTFTTTLNPYSATDESKCVSPAYRAVDWTITNNNVTDSFTIYNWDILTQGINKQGKFNVSYTVKSSTPTVGYIQYVTRSTEFECKDLKGYVKIPINTPEIKLNKTSLTLQVGDDNVVTVSTLPENSNFSFNYDKNYISVTKDNNKLKIKGLKKGSTTLTVIGNMTIMSYMTQPVANLVIDIVDSNLSKINDVANKSYSLRAGKIMFTDNANATVYREAYKKSDNYDYDSGQTVNIHTLISFVPIRFTVDVKFSPKVCTDILNVTSSDDDIVTIPVDQSEPSYIDDPDSSIIGGELTDNFDINLTDFTSGTVTVAFWAVGAGNATITLKSSRIDKITTSFKVTVSEDKTVTLTSDKSSIVDVTNDVKQTGYRSTFVVKTGNNDGTTTLTATPKAGQGKKVTAKFINRLVPDKVDLYLTGSKNISEVDSYAGDIIELTASMEPNVLNNISRQVNTKYRKMNYIYKYNNLHIITGSKYRADNNNNLLDNFKFEVPLDILADSYTITAVSEKNSTLIKDFKISVTQPDINIKGQKISKSNLKYVDIYLANIDNVEKKLVSSEELIVEVTPSNQTYILDPKDNNTLNGYKWEQDSKDKSKLKITATSSRNLKKKNNSKSEASATDAMYKNNNAPKVNGTSFNVVYNGKIQDGRTRPFVRVNVYTLQYFGVPEIVNAYKNEIHYYSEVPKIVFKLPKYNDFDNLDDIEIAFRGSTYSFKKNPELFSIYYNGNTKGHSLISSAIADYKTKDGNSYCVFTPSNAVTDGNVSITFKATKFDNIPDATTKISVYKKALPVLPKVGDKIKLDDIKPYLNAINDVISPYLITNNSTERFGINFNDLSSIGTIEKNKESAIMAMPFFKLLFLLNKYLLQLNEKATYTNNSVIVTPSNLTFDSVRDMYVKKSSRTTWYENYVNSSSIYFKNADKQLYDEYNSIMGVDLYKDEFSDVSYPVMVDDSNDFVGEADYGFINKFKNNVNYSKYTISPLTEIIKALKQF